MEEEAIPNNADILLEEEIQDNVEAIPDPQPDPLVVQEGEDHVYTPSEVESPDLSEQSSDDEFYGEFLLCLKFPFYFIKCLLTGFLSLFKFYLDINFVVYFCLLFSLF